jgi:hypothetical protein
VDEATFRVMSVVLQLLTGVGLIGGAVFALWRYYDSTEKEFRKPLWERQISLYMSATRAAATLATREAGDSWNMARIEFWTLYHGELCIVEDEKVENAMVKFGDFLEAYERETDPDRKEKARKMLEEGALVLAHRCRESLGKAWQADLSGLTAKYTEYPEQ